MFSRVEAVLLPRTWLSLILFASLYFSLTKRMLGTFVEVRDRVMGDHKPGAIILVVKALARPELKIEIEAIAARVD